MRLPNTVTLVTYVQWVNPYTGQTVFIHPRWLSVK